MDPRLTKRPAGSRKNKADTKDSGTASSASSPDQQETDASKSLRSRFSTSRRAGGSSKTTSNKTNLDKDTAPSASKKSNSRSTSKAQQGPVFPNDRLTVKKNKPLPKTPPSVSGQTTPRQHHFRAVSEESLTFLLVEEDAPGPPLSRFNTMDSSFNNPEIYGRPRKESESPYIPSDVCQNGENNARDDTNVQNTPGIASAPSPAQPSTNNAQAPPSSSTHLSGLMCNVHRTTGREPHSLVGATTTILGDKLYVFGGKILSRTRAALTADLYELDLIKRHWTKLDTKGDIPPPRYFHSMCSLGDTKLVCYGGMSPTTQPSAQSQSPTQSSQDSQPEVVVMSDIHIYDAPTNTWTYVPTAADTPQGRYAHCATIMPSSATFANSTNAPLSALQHNPSTDNPNQGSIGVNIDGTGGAEMVVVGGQDSANHYIEQISIFNLRSLKWTRTEDLGKMCGAYRSVVAPVSPEVSAIIGKGAGSQTDTVGMKDDASSMLIYSNYNFLDVKLELQIRSADGALIEKPMNGSFTPPGLRFPNGGVIDTNFVVSGTYLTSSKQEYALWALDLKTLTWSRIDAGGNVFSQGSWNRGVLWNRRNTFVILGNRKRSLVEDYNHRRLNFSNICMVELEAFGLYDNPRKTTPMSGYMSASSPTPNTPLPPTLINKLNPWQAGGRTLSVAAEDLGALALTSRELADMDILAVGGERIPVNSRIVARRWGPYFIQILREGAAAQDGGNDAATLRPRDGSISSGETYSSRNDRMSSVTITKLNSNTSSGYSGSTLNVGSSDSLLPSGNTAGQNISPQRAPELWNPPDSNSLLPTSRPRTLYLPHTHLTIQSLLHFLYTSSLPPSNSPLCTPQILCSLLQFARPYRIDGLVEAVIERLHRVLDSRNAAAVFNAAAMAAGGGRSLSGSDAGLSSAIGSMAMHDGPQSRDRNLSTSTADGLRINTALSFGFENANTSESEDGGSAVSEVGSGWENDGEPVQRMKKEREVWRGEVSAVIGLQKRGLRGLMEGRRLRERGQSGATAAARAAASPAPGNAMPSGVGLGVGVI